MKRLFAFALSLAFWSPAHSAILFVSPPGTSGPEPPYGTPGAVADDAIGGSGEGDEPIPELRWYTFVVDEDAADNALTAGWNYVLALEIHQVNQTSSDASLNLQLLLKYTE